MLVKMITEVGGRVKTVKSLLTRRKQSKELADFCLCLGEKVII